MFEDEGIEEGFGGLLVLAAELGDGFELELEVLVGAAALGAEDQLGGGDAQRDRSKRRITSRVGWEEPAS